MDLVEKVNNVDLSSILKEKVPLKDAYYELDISSINDDIKNCKLKDVELKLENYSTALKCKLNKLCQRYLLDGEFKTSFKLLRNSILSLSISYYPADGYRLASEPSASARDVIGNVFLHFIPTTIDKGFDVHKCDYGDHLASGKVEIEKSNGSSFTHMTKYPLIDKDKKQVDD